MLLLMVIYPFPSLYPNRIDMFTDILKKRSIDLPYGVTYTTGESSSLSPFIYVREDTSKFTSFGFKFEYLKGNYGFVIAPIFKRGDTLVFPDKEWKNLVAADFDYSGIYIKNKYFYGWIGRNHQNFGPSPLNNPILSTEAPPFSNIMYSFKGKKFDINLFYSSLDRYNGPQYDPSITISDTVSIQRHLLIHRLEISPSKWLGIGFTEMSLFGNKYGEILPSFFNPFRVYYADQFNERENSNVFWNFDWVILLKNNLLYGNFLIDDFQYESDPYNEPDHIGINIGFFSNICSDNFLLIEYNRFSRWVYGHYLVWQRYIYSKWYIGMNPAANFENLYVIFYMINDKFRLSPYLNIQRSGETNPYTPWPVNYNKPPDSLNSFPDNNFLDGTIQKKLSGGAEIKISRWVNIEVSLGGIYFTNYNHKNGVNKFFPLIHLQFSKKFNL